MSTTEKGLSSALNARIEGCGTETIVFAHGYGTDQSIWDKIHPLVLALNYRLVTFDWAFAGTVKDQSLYDPHKYSSVEAFADDLITLLNEMDLKAVTFVGHSMSGIIGCIASVKRPQLFKTLILVGASPRYHLLFFNFCLLVWFVLFCYPCLLGSLGFVQLFLTMNMIS